MLRPDAQLRHLVVDRDGVLNREATHGWVTDRGAWVWEADALNAMVLCARHGIRVSVVTNQSCVGRGLVSRREVDHLHDWLGGQLRGLGVDLVGVFVCPHAPGDGCTCRKPAPGLVRRAVMCSRRPAADTVMVGDAPSDVAAGRAAGVTAWRVGTGKGARCAPDALDGATLLHVLRRLTLNTEVVS